MDLALAVGIRGTAAVFIETQAEVHRLAEDLVNRTRRAGSQSDRCPADRRIEAFLNKYFADVTQANPLKLPTSIVLPRYGIAREFSFPAGGNTYSNEYVTSFRVRNG